MDKFINFHFVHHGRRSHSPSAADLPAIRPMTSASVTLWEGILPRSPKITSVHSPAAQTGGGRAVRSEKRRTRRPVEPAPEGHGRVLDEGPGLAQAALVRAVPAHRLDAREVEHPRARVNERPPGLARRAGLVARGDVGAEERVERASEVDVGAEAAVGENDAEPCADPQPRAFSGVRQSCVATIPSARPSRMRSRSIRSPVRIRREDVALGVDADRRAEGLRA